MTDRLLVVRGGALGDFVLGLPALHALRRAFPGASLELIAPAAVLPLASQLVDVATPLERAEVAYLFLGGEGLPGEVVGRYRDLDLVVVWLSDPDGSVRGSFQRLGARRLLWAPPIPSGPGRHAADHLLDTLGPLGIPGVVDAATPSVAVPRDRASALLRRPGVDPGRPPVAVHPGSGGDWKRWPAERFARVADGLLAAGREVVLIQGPADERAVAEVVAAVREGRPEVASGQDVEELAALLSLCSCYLGNDSGVTHLAAAVGTPTVALFGPTDPSVWGPRGRRVAVLRGEVECAPCSRGTALECRARSCLETVTVEQVLEAVAAMLDGGD